MKGFPVLLDLERRAWPCQIPSTEMRLAKRQVEKLAGTLPQHPTIHTRLNSVLRGEREKEGDVVPEDFVHFFRAVVYHLLGRILRRVRIPGRVFWRMLTQTSPLAVIIASIVPFRTSKP